MNKVNFKLTHTNNRANNYLFKSMKIAMSQQNDVFLNSHVLLFPNMKNNKEGVKWEGGTAVYWK